ncbi:MAG TPA: trypsin-like peptidase domain-containing protein [Gemmataceae bacterium]|nr:trypsin-like peptidase domain-containing protein [Gemmataceae bacterium]
MRLILTAFLLLATTTISIAETPRKRRSPVVDLVNKVKPAIVTISGTAKSDDGKKPPPLGLGAIIDKAGLIVTPRHVVQGKENLDAVLADGRKLTAKMILSDAAAGLAILKVASAKPVPCAKLADSAKVEVGDFVVGFGLPFKDSVSCAMVVISSTNREVQGTNERLLQWDSSIGPGSVCDIIINLDGEIVGIDYRVGRNQGVGFALPSNRVKEIVAKAKSASREDQRPE